MSVHVPKRVAASIVFFMLALAPEPDWQRWVVGPIGPFNPPPITETGFHVLVVEETEDRDNLPRPQLNALLGTEWRGYVVGKKGQFRIVDDDSALDRDVGWVKEGMSQPRTGVPWLIVSNGKAGASIPFPKDDAELLTTLKKYGGE